ncbi:MAG: hypothetical protein GXP55_16855 [Deltaproteobacteria bacterium]|nr:hypothetical protein [Deltaproteobacteria bacterium]
MDENNGHKNFKVVYTIVDRQRDGKKFWLRIGAAFENRDGSMNVLLDAMPTNGQLQIREYRPFEERGDRGDRGSERGRFNERAESMAG